MRSEGGRIPLSELEDTVARQLVEAQALRASSLGLLRDAQAARGRALERTMKALPKDFCRKQLEALEQARRANRTLVDHLEHARARAAQMVPPPAVDRLIVFGLVHDAAGKPVRGVRMTLHDESGRLLTRAKPVRTDATGAYVLVLGVVEPSKKARSRARSKTGHAEGTGTATNERSSKVYVGTQRTAEKEPSVSDVPIALVAGTRAAHHVRMDG